MYVGLYVSVLMCVPAQMLAGPRTGLVHVIDSKFLECICVYVNSRLAHIEVNIILVLTHFMCVIQREWVANSAFHLLVYTSTSSTRAYLRAFALACHSRDSYKEWQRAQDRGAFNMQQIRSTS